MTHNEFPDQNAITYSLCVQIPLLPQAAFTLVTDQISTHHITSGESEAGEKAIHLK